MPSSSSSSFSAAIVAPPAKRSTTAGDRQQQAPPSTTTIATLLASPVWASHVLPCLRTFDLVRLAGASQSFRAVHTDDDVWRPWVQEIGNGRFYALLCKAGVISRGGRSLMEAYMEATSCECVNCFKRVDNINLLTLEPMCPECFRDWYERGLMDEDTARQQYALSKKDIDALPSLLVRYPAWRWSTTRLLARDHAEARAIEKYGSLAALQKHKRHEKAVAKGEWELKLSTYEAKRAAAERRGLPRPQRPHEPPAAWARLEIDQKDGDGWIKNTAVWEEALYAIGPRICWT